ncbi:MAG: hypothetical protein BWY85_01374 [Firmicutes bacterium ADurb.Bin506]|nr:MAG: hypothetical protein BWY85_01374 [Firmicutes bacterium ADurb.Bin506]
MNAVAAKPLTSWRPHWAKRFGTAPFLPMSRAEMQALGWDQCDIILVTGDAYIDHPSFGMALIGRTLEAQGFRVGIISQPDWHSADAFRALGKPRLFYGITAGNMDSMINRYTADRKPRSDDAYTADALPDKRPDRAVVVYAQRAREAYPDANIVIGSIEASLRRIAHYDHWSEKVRRSVLPDSKADLLIFGSGERAVIALAHRLAAGEPIEAIRDLRGTAFMVKPGWHPEGWVEIDLTPPDTPLLEPLPEYTNASSILLTWTAVDGAVRYDLEGIASGLTATGYRLELTPETHPDGTEIITRVRAYDKAGNVSGWSSAVSTIIDRTGPTTTIDGDPPPALTNNSMPTWKWKGDDGTGSGVAYYIVKLDDEPSFTTTDEMFTPSRGLEPGVHVLRVTAVDAIGNVGNELVFPDVTVVNPVVVRVTPLPGSYPINQVSTVVLGVTGVVDAELSVAIGSTDLADERIIEIARTVEMSKFYVLLDEEVLSPGELVLTVTAGATVEKFFYEVLNERSGFGFGRLRPW